MKKLLLCSVLLASFSAMNAQNWLQENFESQKIQLFKSAPEQLDAPNVNYNLQDDEIFMGYAKETSKFNGIGVGQPAKFNCAIRIPASAAKGFKGNKITMIRVLLARVKYISGCKVWVRQSLEGQNIVEQTCDLTKAGAGKWNDIALDTPYEITGDEFYIGYSFSLDKLSSKDDAYAVGVDPTEHPEGLYLQFNQAKWGNYYGQDLGSLAILGVCKGKFVETDVAMVGVESTFLKAGAKASLSAEFSNLGKSDVKNLDFEYTLNGETKNMTNVAVEPVAAFQNGTFKFEVTAPQNVGEAKVTVKITKVNGKDDENPSNNTGEGAVNVLSNLGKRKVLIEEVTGTWCGYCPRGAVALEKINKELSDKAVCVAVHNGDDFVTSSYNAIGGMVQGLPGAVVDREISCDPYYGTSQKNFGIADLINERAQIQTPIDVDVTSTVNGNKVNVTASVKFYFNSDKCDYKVAYVLMEDGLKARQANYYSGATGLPEDLAHLSTEKRYIDKFVLNDVARFIYKFNGIDGSLEGAIKDGEAKTHSYDITLSNVKDVNNAKVAVILFDKSGKVVNVNQAKLNTSSGIEETGVDTFKPEITAEYGVVNIEGEGKMTVEVFTVGGSKVASAQIVDNGSIALNGLNGIYMVRVNNGNDVFVAKVAL